MPAEPADGEHQEQDVVESIEEHVAIKDNGGDEADGDAENYDGETANGGFSNMGFPGTGDFNQMQMMMAMQNGMGPNAFGGFPMMGESSLLPTIHACLTSSMAGMDPMTMQNMYMNGGFQGMGMNGMGGFGGGFGQGSNNWNGSQSWNFDQNNYNQNGPGMGTGDFGNFNSGFQTGYNQGNYGQFNNYRHNNFGRGRGRGRGYYGGYGRGGYQAAGNMNYQDQGQFSQYGPGNQGQVQGTTEAEGGQSGDQKDVDEYGREIRPQNGDSEGGQAADEGSGEAPAAGDKDSSAIASRETHGTELTGEALPNGNNITQQTPGSFHQRNGSGVIQSVLATPDVPINAPTGPKAMRQGLPNTSLLNLRARGYQVDDKPPSRPSTAAQDPPAERGRSRSRSSPPDRASTRDDRDRNSGERSKDRSRDYDRRDTQSGERDRKNSQSRSRSGSKSRNQSRSRSRGHRSSRRRRRDRSESAGENDYEDDRRRKKHKSRRHHDESEDYSRSADKEEKYAERSRSASPAESRRSTHRSRRDRDRDNEKRREREKDRDKDKYRDEDRKKSSHRSHRDRDHDRERRRDKDKEREKDRKDRKERHRERDRDRDRDSRHGGSRRHSTDAGDTPAEKDFKPPSGPRGYDIKGSSTNSRRDSQASVNSKSTKKDPHTLEREARDRERLLKEAQRIAGMGLKRSRGDDGDSGSRKGRRVGRRSEAVSGGDEEERMRRLEAEREGERWG